MIKSHSVRVEYSEDEAAEMLGIEVGELQRLIREHVVNEPEAIAGLQARTYLAADLVALRILRDLSRR